MQKCVQKQVEIANSIRPATVNARRLTALTAIHIYEYNDQPARVRWLIN